MILLVCFYISGYAYLAFVGNGINILDIFKVLLLWRIPGYSEFLLSFAMLNVVIYACFKILQQVSVNKYKIVYIAVITGFLTNALLDVPLMLLCNKIGLPPYYGASFATILGYTIAIVIVLIVS